MGSVHDRLKAARVLRGISQPELADLLGVSLQTVRRRESGKSPATLEVLLDIAEVCSVPLAWLVEGFSDEQINEPLAVTLSKIKASRNAERPPPPEQ